MVERLFDGTVSQPFLEDFYLRVPYSRAGGAKELIELGTWDSLAQLLAQRDVDVLVVRTGERWPGELPLTLERARQLVADGYTLVIRHAERHLEKLRPWADGFRTDLSGDVNIHLYCTPPQQFGFGWHYDAEEVFIVQTTGSKEYSLRKNSVNPWPVMETLPQNMQYEREIMPLMRCRLQAGDWLYIPSGYWHMGRADEEAISLAIGVRPTTGVDVFDYLRREVLASLRWRQRLPPLGAGEISPEIRDQYEEVFHDLAEDVGRMLRSEAVLEGFFHHRRQSLK